MVINEPPGVVSFIAHNLDPVPLINHSWGRALLAERRARWAWSWAAIIGWAAFGLHVWWRW